MQVDYNAIYNPAHLMEELEVQVEQPTDLHQMKAAVHQEPAGDGIGIAGAPPSCGRSVDQKREV